MSPLVRTVAAGLMAFGAAIAAAAGWSVQLPDGRRVALVADGGADPFTQTLERRHPDGSLDRQFGDGGRVVISLGAESPGPRSVRVDGGGRLLVVGAAMGPEGRAAPASLRFLPDGRIDLSWGVQGRSLISLPGAEAFGADVLPMPDNSVLVLAQIESDTGERAALWRLGGNGAVDAAFGQAGVMRATGLDSSQALALQLDDDGAALIAIQTTHQGQAWLEVHRWQPGLEQPQRVALQPAPADWQGPPTLSRRGGMWQWFDASQPINSGGVPLMAVAAVSVWNKGAAASPGAAMAAQAQPSEGGAAWNPFEPATQAEAVVVGAGAASERLPGLPWLALGGVALAALVGLAWWRRRRKA